MNNAIIFVVGKDPLGLGGGPAYARAHALAAAAAGFEPHIFYAAPVVAVLKTEYGFIHQPRQSLLNSLPQNSGIELNKFLIGWQAPRVAAEIERFLISRPGPHLIHGFSIWGYTALLARERLRRHGAAAAVVSSVYTTTEYESRVKAQRVGDTDGRLKRLALRFEYAVLRRTAARYERRLFAESDLVTLNYEAVRKLFLADYGPGAEVRKLSYASESSFLHESGKAVSPEPEAIAALEPREAPLIVSVSRHDPRKGVGVLLHALARLRAKGTPFRACLTSGGMLLDQHRRMASRLGLDGSVAITGWVPDPYPYLRRADIFALPSLQEASGSVSLLEALQAGVAVVASNVDGVPEDVTDGDGALLVEPGDVDQLSRALALALTDSELRGRLRRRAREIFVDNFSAEAFTAALGGLYAELKFKAGNG
jgi:glycosyltransferase involved in cell wall biosynthesis